MNALIGDQVITLEASDASQKDFGLYVWISGDGSESQSDESEVVVAVSSQI